MRWHPDACRPSPDVLVDMLPMSRGLVIRWWLKLPAMWLLMSERRHQMAYQTPVSGQGRRVSDHSLRLGARACDLARHGLIQSLHETYPNVESGRLA